MSLLDLLILILRRRRMVLGMSTTLAILTIGIGVLWRRQWSASASFYPQTSQGALAQLGGLAAQFGVDVAGGSSPEDSPDFYVALVISDPFLREVVQAPLVVDSAGVRREVSMIDAYQIDRGSPGRDTDAVVKKLRADIDIHNDYKTGVVNLEIHGSNRYLAVALVNRILDDLNQYNLTYRRTGATAQREFVERRLEESRGELHQAETTLEDFLSRNRVIGSSPQLQFEYDRLKREVDLRAQVYTTLTTAYEQARMDEVRNTPVVTIVSRPFLADLPVSRRLTLKALLVFVAGGILGVLIALVQAVNQDTGDPTRRGSPEWRILVHESYLDLRHPLDRIILPVVRELSGRWRSNKET